MLSVDSKVEGFGSSSVCFSFDQRSMCLPYEAPLENVFRAITYMIIISVFLLC